MSAASRSPLVSSSRPRRASKHALRLQRLLEREIDYIPNPEFGSADTGVDPQVQAILDRPRSVGAARGAIGRLGEREVLRSEEEVALFREMNRLKYVASCLREQLPEKGVRAAQLTKIETLLSDAERVRDHLIESNLRLVISLAKKFVSPITSFDELVSEGVFTLMKAVEKFDFDRGFRFSTYAYRSIARDAYRQVSSAAKLEAKTMRQADEWAFEQQEDHSSSPLKDQVWSNLREKMESMLEHLDRRERFIVRSRYALGSHRKSRSFKYLGDRLGVSKERARQLEKRAVDKLKAMAAEYDLDELLGAAMA